VKPFRIAIRPSRYQFWGWLCLYAAVFGLASSATLPVVVYWVITLCLSVFAVRLLWSRFALIGPFAVKLIHCDAHGQWQIQFWGRRKEWWDATLRSYQATPLGLALSWCVTPAAVLNKIKSEPGTARRVEMLVTRDQLSEGDYRWLKVLLINNHR
jgi:hypothetical protein